MIVYPLKVGSRAAGPTPTPRRPFRTVAMATFPPRREGMLQVVNALLPQCDKFYLYLNKYKRIPPRLPKNPKLVCIVGNGESGHPDLGSHAKFYWCGRDDGYYFTVDDDINYPSNYIDVLAANLDRYDGRVLLGGHGTVFHSARGGSLTDDKAFKKQGKLYGYSAGVTEDAAVHILGTGVMGCCPKKIGLHSVGPRVREDSGDDEDVAIWAQQRGIAMVRVATPRDWITPKANIWIINPLHQRQDYVQASDEKIKSWKTWRLFTAPVVNPKVRIPWMKDKPPPQRKQRPANLDRIDLKPADRAFCRQILSSDALAALIVDRIKRKRPTSVIRMSDGEGAIIRAFKKQSDPLASFLTDEKWLVRYGLQGVNIREVGRKLLWAGGVADFLACTISGLFVPHFRVHQHFPDRLQFIDQFYPRLWEATDRVGAVLSVAPVLVLHRNADRVAAALRSKYGLDNIKGLPLDSHKDHAGYLQSLQKYPAGLILVSGGASGKPFVVQLARATGKVVLDLGEALASRWGGLK